MLHFVVKKLFRFWKILKIFQRPGTSLFTQDNRYKQKKIHVTFKFNLGREPVTNKWKLFGKEN